MSFTMHEKKPGKLKKIVIDRIDIVDKGANPDARIVFFKRESEGISVEKFEDLKRRAGNLFRPVKEKIMNTTEITKAVEAGQIQTREQAWTLIQRMIDEEVGRELVRGFEEQRTALSREQLLLRLITTTDEGRQLWAAWQSLPEGQVAKVEKAEASQPASWGRIEKMAKSLVSEGKAATIQEAVAQVATANPDLYREYRREIQ